MFNLFRKSDKKASAVAKTAQENLFELMLKEKEKQLAAKAAVEKQQALVEKAKALGDRMIAEKLTKKDQLLREEKLMASTYEALELLHKIQGR